MPISTMRTYADRLTAQGLQPRVVVDQQAGQQWLSASPLEVRDWFLSHP